MCLDRFTKFKAPKYGFKVFEVYGSKLLSIHSGNRKNYEIGKILNEKSYRRSTYMGKKCTLLTDTTKQEYPLGFHIVQTKEAAMVRASYMSNINSEVYKVEIIEPIATGQEFADCKFRNVIVSKK